MPTDKSEKIVIVAANPGFEVLEYHHNNGGDDACVSRSPIVAWRVVEGKYAEPVLTETTLTNEVFIKYPDGRVNWPECQVWDSEALWLEDITIRFEREQKKSA